MLTGHLPFDDDNVGRLLAKIKLGRFLPLPGHVSREARDLIKSMLVVDPAKRITVSLSLRRRSKMDGLTGCAKRATGAHKQKRTMHDKCCYYYSLHFPLLSLLPICLL